jgi:hypothetical protein
MNIIPAEKQRRNVLIQAKKSVVSNILESVSKSIENMVDYLDRYCGVIAPCGS